MNTQRKRFIVLGILVIFAILTWIGYSVVKYFSPTETIAPYADDDCFASFEDFAYAASYPASSQRENISLSQWTMVAKVPNITLDATVLATRKINGDTEVWVQRNHRNEEDAKTYKFYIYQVNKQEWKTVTAGIGDSHIFVNKLFVRSDGTLWGRNSANRLSEMSYQPVLSRYNDETGKFEAVETTRAIPNGTEGRYGQQYWTKTILDSRGVFWFVVEGDAIYSFDVTTQTVERHADLSNTHVKDAYQSMDGKIYIWRYPSDPTYSMPSFKMGEEEILRFDP